jgi:hypothetical protein
MDKLTAYEIVIADIAQDIGWKEGKKEEFLYKLQHRVWELVEVLGNKKPKYEVIEDTLWVADDGSWGSGELLIAKVSRWTDAQVTALEELTHNDDPTIDEVINILEDTKEVD